MTCVGNVCVVFDNYGVKIQDRKSCEVLGYGNLIGNIYLLLCIATLALNTIQSCSACRDVDDMLQLWHRRLGHCGAR